MSSHGDPTDVLTTWYKHDDKGTGIRSVSGRSTPNGKVLDRDTYPRRVTRSNGWCPTRREAREVQVARARRRVRKAEEAFEKARAYLEEVESLLHDEDME